MAASWGPFTSGCMTFWPVAARIPRSRLAGPRRKVDTMSLTLTWRAATSIPVDGSVLRPETFLDSLADQASRSRLAMGNTSMELGELFRVQGTRGDERLTI